NSPVILEVSFIKKEHRRSSGVPESHFIYPATQNVPAWRDELRRDERCLVIDGVKSILGHLLRGFHLAIPDAASGIGDSVLEEQHVEYSHAGRSTEGTAHVLVRTRAASGTAGTVQHVANLGEINLYHSDWSGSIDLVAAQG